MVHLAFILSLFLFSFVPYAWGNDSLPLQNQTERQTQTEDLPEFGEEEGITSVRHFYDDIEFWNSIFVLVFALLVLFMIFYKFKATPMDATTFFHLTILVLVIISSLYLIAAGFDNKQTAPAYGILGTIAGYLLGVQHARKKNN